MAGVHGKGQSCHVLPKSLHTVFSTWVLPTRWCRARWSRSTVPVNQHLLGRGRGWQRCQWSAQLLQSKEHSLWYTKDTCAWICSASSSIHTGSSSTDSPSTHTVVCTITQCYEKKTWFIFVSGCNVLGAGLGLVGLLYCLANLKVALVAVMIKCPSVKLKGQKQLVFWLVRLHNGNTHKL